MFRGIAQEYYNQYIAVLTEAQAMELTNQELAPYWLFNPVILNDNWTISMEEVVGCTNGQFMWVKDLPLIPYFPAE
jgi:hypothetical protein